MLYLINFKQGNALFRAIDLRNDHVIAVKCLSLDVDEVTQRRIETEINVLSQVDQIVSPFALMIEFIIHLLLLLLYVKV